MIHFFKYFRRISSFLCIYVYLHIKIFRLNHDSNQHHLNWIQCKWKLPNIATLLRIMWIYKIITRCLILIWNALKWCINSVQICIWIMIGQFYGCNNFNYVFDSFFFYEINKNRIQSMSRCFLEKCLQQNKIEPFLLFTSPEFCSQKSRK